MYSEGLKNSFRELMENMELAKKLRGFYPPQMLLYKNDHLETAVSQRCKACGEILKAKFGDYSKPLAEKWIPCPNGTPEDKHGYWASAIHINLN